ncbi:MAG: Crp/Fnr family transcriptional regulator [Devosia sp.]
MVALHGSVVGYVADAAVQQMRAMAPAGRDGVAVLVYRELGIAQQRITCLGLRSAIEQMAHFLCETLIRCGRPGSDYKVDRCSLHMTQEMLSSVLGLSTVHVNRTLMQLRRLKLADLVHHELIVHDFDGLAELGEFDDSYLAPI